MPRTGRKARRKKVPQTTFEACRIAATTKRERKKTRSFLPPRRPQKAVQIPAAAPRRGGRLTLAGWRDERRGLERETRDEAWRQRETRLQKAETKRKFSKRNRERQKGKTNTRSPHFRSIAVFLFCLLSLSLLSRCSSARSPAPQESQLSLSRSVPRVHALAPHQISSDDGEPSKTRAKRKERRRKERRKERESKGARFANALA